MEGAFVTVVVAVGIVGVLGAVVTLLAGRSTWESLGRDRLLMESDLDDPRARPASPRRAGEADAGEREQEVRQMLEARNRRRRRRGEPDLDIEVEIARLSAADAGSVPGPSSVLSSSSAPGSAAVDEELLAEIRQLVHARNHRRARAGRPPLDVEAEIARQIARLNG